MANMFVSWKTTFLGIAGIVAIVYGVIQLFS